MSSTYLLYGQVIQINRQIAVFHLLAGYTEIACLIGWILCDACQSATTALTLGGPRRPHLDVMRNILVTISGVTPQVITETLWVLVTRPEQTRFLPHELHIITTGQGETSLRNRLLGNNGKLAEFCEEFGLPPITVRISTARYPSGEAVEDTRDIEANIAFANTLACVIRDLTRDDGTRVHASLAGGRKTMSFYMGYAMSLFGRSQDALSHVMVPPAFESCSDFWWIPKVPKQVCSHKDGRSYSTADARIELAEIPFVRLHHFVREPIFRQANIDFADVVQSVQASVSTHQLVLTDDERRVTIGPLSFQIPHREYAMYRTLAEVARERWPGAGPGGIGSEHRGWLTVRDFELNGSRGTITYLHFYDAVFRRTADRADALAKEITKIGDAKTGDIEAMRSRFREIRSRLGIALEQHIPDPGMRSRFCEHGAGRSPRRFGLVLNPSDIVIGV